MKFSAIHNGWRERDCLPQLETMPMFESVFPTSMATGMMKSKRLPSIAFSLSVFSFISLGLTACASPSFRAFYIVSEAMLPTLEVGDRITVDPQAYQTDAPERGDIVAFIPPEDAFTQLGIPADSDTVFVMQVVGLPGEEIVVREGSVFINNQPLVEDYLAEPPSYQWEGVTIPDHHYAVLGDNRNNSFDSRFWGGIPHDRLVGKATFRYFPLNRVGGIE
ncbi:signal peptidase I [filamentous cyanobacterium CCP2]|nr:signal peptidase I [filamentous cyanobacterium CCP2]